jgi:hypothetical protein
MRKFLLIFIVFFTYNFSHAQAPTFLVTEYNSSCYGDNNGAASIAIPGGTTPTGTVSVLSYCSSNPNLDPLFLNQPATIIEEVSIIGDNFNLLNNTAGTNDSYEDYTLNTGLQGEYADLTQGTLYTANIIAQDISLISGSYAPQAINVYIDFNIDGDFLDAGEDLGVINITWGTWAPGTVYPFNFTVPTTGVYGATRMRVVCMSNADQAPIIMGPCVSPSGAMPHWFGATEDYSVVLNSPYASATFLWGNGSTADSISNLAPGTYPVTITVAGNQLQDSAVITEPIEIMFNPIVTNVSCNSLNDGIITLNPSGANGGGYTYIWSNGQLTQTASGLQLGSYNCTVTDPTTITANNSVACYKDTIISIIEPPYFSVDFTTSIDTICFNESVTLDFNFNVGGVAPYIINYTINSQAQVIGPVNNSGIYNTPISPSPGNNTYIISNITDNNGCVNQNLISAQNIFVNALPDVGMSIAPNPICISDSAFIFFNQIEGQWPLQVYYNSDGVIGSSTIQILASGSVNKLVNPNLTTTYELDSVSDANECVNSLSGNITLIVNEIPKMNWSVPSNVCDNDIVYLSFEFLKGSPPWSVEYNINGTTYNLPPTYNTLDSVSIAPLNGSVYSINLLSDVNSCKDVLNEELTIVSYPLPEIVLSGGGSICDDGSTANIIFTTSSGTPPYNLTYAAGLTSYFASDIENIYTFPTKKSGTYSIQNLTDSRGCKPISITGNVSVNINPLPQANITAYPQPANILNPQISFIDKSDNHIYGIWSFDDGDSALTNFGRLVHTFSDTGTYNVSLVIESDSGCSAIDTQTIIISPVFTIYVPNAFTPNNDLYNDYFLPIIDGVSEYEFIIYDRSGYEIFKTNEYSNDYLACIENITCDAAWNGKINNGNEYATKGVYVYTINLTDFKGKLRTYEGAFTLIR